MDNGMYKPPVPRVHAQRRSKTRHNGKGLNFMKLCLGTALIAVTPAWLYGQVIPHIAVGGSYTTEFVILNPTTGNGSISVSFYDDDGKSMSVRLPDLNT